MSNTKNTALFAGALLVAVGAVAADYATSEAPAPKTAAQESFNPCAAAAPAPAPGQRNYDDLADQFSGGSAVPAAPAPEPAPASDINPCSAGVL